MWTHQAVGNAEANMMMTPSCCQWPTLCWSVLKCISVVRVLGMDRHLFLWLSLTSLAMSIAVAAQLHKRKERRMQADRILEQERDQRLYELSMDNLLSTMDIEQIREPSDSTWSDMKSSPEFSQLSLRRSLSFSSNPKKSFKEASTDSTSLKHTSLVSQYTQTVATKRNRLAANPNNRVKQLTQLPTNERRKFAQQLNDIIERSKKTPIWRH